MAHLVGKQKLRNLPRSVLVAELLPDEPFHRANSSRGSRDPGPKKDTGTSLGFVQVKPGGQMEVQVCTRVAVSEAAKRAATLSLIPQKWR